MVTKSLGNNLFASKHRLYRLYKVDGKTKCKLLTWEDKHCIICGKFLHKHTETRCRKCTIEHRKEIQRRCQKKYRDTHKEERQLRKRVYCNAYRYNIGDYV